MRMMKLGLHSGICGSLRYTFDQKVNISCIISDNSDNRISKSMSNFVTWCAKLPPGLRENNDYGPLGF